MEPKIGKSGVKQVVTAGFPAAEATMITLSSRDSLPSSCHFHTGATSLVMRWGIRVGTWHEATWACYRCKTLALGTRACIFHPDYVLTWVSFRLPSCVIRYILNAILLCTYLQDGLFCVSCLPSLLPLHGIFFPFCAYSLLASPLGRASAQAMPAMSDGSRQHPARWCLGPRR